MKKAAVAVTGPSNSGKTTLIVKISEKLIATNKEVAIIKHDPKDKAVFDTEGKDSYKFSQTGAQTAVVSPSRTTCFLNESKSLEEMIEIFKDFDYLLVEGLKTLSLPRIAVFRNSIDESYFPYSNAIAIDKSVDITSYRIPEGITVLNLNDTDEIIAWIEKNAKKV